MKFRLALWIWIIVLAAGWILGITDARAQSGDSNPLAVVLTMKGPLSPVQQEYLRRGLQIAEDRQASLVILQLDTPGGSIDTMNNMIQLIRGSSVPVVVYVAPQNAMAGSAGTLITLAGHVAAMAPETTIGAASPVGAQGEDIGQTMETKVKEMMQAKVRELAKDRPPEAIQLGEDMIGNAKAVTVEEALKVGLVDLQARNLDDLLSQLDGRTVKFGGRTVVLRTRDAQTLPVGNTLIEQILLFLVNPDLVFMLLSLGTWAIIIEISSPGGWVAGFIGVVCILLAIYGLGILPVNWFGLLFLVVAFVLFVLEVKTPTHGLMTIAGVASFIIGALVLFNSIRLPGAPAAPGFPTVSVWLVAGTAVFIAFSFLGIVTFALRAQRAPVVTGQETLLGQIGMAQTALIPRGMVHIAGEQWMAQLAEGEEPIQEGDRVEVVHIEGLRLIVRKAR